MKIHAVAAALCCIIVRRFSCLPSSWWGPLDKSTTNQRRVCRERKKFNHDADIGFCLNSEKYSFIQSRLKCNTGVIKWNKVRSIFKNLSLSSFKKRPGTWTAGVNVPKVVCPKMQSCRFSFTSSTFLSPSPPSTHHQHQPASLSHIWSAGCCATLGPPAAHVDVHGRLDEQSEQSARSPWCGGLCWQQFCSLKPAGWAKLTPNYRTGSNEMQSYIFPASFYVLNFVIKSLNVRNSQQVNWSSQDVKNEWMSLKKSIFLNGKMR